MGVYNVSIREIHVNIVEVELSAGEERLGPIAKSDLIKKLALSARENQDDTYMEYSHDMPEDYWTIEKVG